MKKLSGKRNEHLADCFGPRGTTELGPNPNPTKVVKMARRCCAARHALQRPERRRARRLSAIVVGGAAPTPTFIPTFSWTGFYVGVTAGYEWSNVSTWDPDVRSGLLGGQTGYNHQISNLGNFVVGTERDGA